MTACKEGAKREGLMLDSHEELYKWVIQKVMEFARCEGGIWITKKHDSVFIIIVMFFKILFASISKKILHNPFM